MSSLEMVATVPPCAAFFVHGNVQPCAVSEMSKSKRRQLCDRRVAVRVTLNRDALVFAPASVVANRKLGMGICQSDAQCVAVLAYLGNDDAVEKGGSSCGQEGKEKLPRTDGDSRDPERILCIRRSLSEPHAADTLPVLPESPVLDKCVVQADRF